jgi:hypothetical protein
MSHIPSMAWMVPDNSPSVVDARPNMVWNPSLSEFVLNRICELADRGLNLSRGFKECYLKSVCNDVKDFTCVTVTPCHVYNHMRNWKMKWTTTRKLKNLPGVTFDSASYAIIVEKEEFKHHLRLSFAYHFFAKHVQTTMVHSTNQMSSHC